MSSSNPAPKQQKELANIESTETGARSVKGKTGLLLFCIPIFWSLWQLIYASPALQWFGISWLNEDIAKYIHLAFALFLAFMFFPAFKGSARKKIPQADWVLALLATLSVCYLIIFRESIVMRLGAPTTLDVIVGSIGALLLLEATRRALGPPLMVVAIVFLSYTFAGPYMPGVIAHKGASLNKVLSHQWFTTEGIFGVAIGVSTTFVFLFVLFGALLDKAGAGNYFIKVAFSLLGHLRGGPAKAAVVASGLSGVVSGSSIANVVTTGTFTIPLMKRIGFPGSKAGAIEVAASTNGQLTPPIMGAAAFLMVEYVGISYVEVIKHAILPALISYIALFYIVHLEAMKAGMQGLPRRDKRSLAQSLLLFMGSFLFLLLFSAFIYYGVGWSKAYMGGYSTWLITAFVLALYLLLVKYAAAYPDLEADDPNSKILEIPELGPTVKSGLYFLLPIGVLIWCLTVERWSPGTSAFWATLFMIFIVITHRPLLACFRKEQHWKADIIVGVKELVAGFNAGGRNMIGIGVATSAAGIVVGTVTLTGIGLVMTDFVEFISGGNIMLMLLFTAVISLILGMGLPTTANYIVVSTLMAPVIVTLGAQNGLLIPLIAVHLFVFYFGILADDTPPVGLAAFAAAAIAKADPIKTGIQGFTYDIRTAILPFMFIFNTQLLLIDIGSIWELLLTIFSAIVAMLAFSAATQGFWLVKSRIYETLLLLLVAFMMFRPGFFWDKIYPPTTTLAANEIYQEVSQLQPGEPLKLHVAGENLEGIIINKKVILSMPEDSLQLDNDAESKLMALGLMLSQNDEQINVDLVSFDSPAEKAGLDFGWQINAIEKSLKRPAKQWFYIPALLLLFSIGFMQLKRRGSTSSPTSHKAT